MKLELKALAILQTYCSRPDGQYPPPTNLFTLGPPDMPVKSIEVETNSKYQTRTVVWYYPYKRLAFSLQGGELEERFTMPLHCQSPKVSSSQATKLQLECAP